MIDLLLEQLGNSPVLQGVIASLIAAGLLASLAFGRQVAALLLKGFDRNRGSTLTAQRLRRYRGRLRADLFQVRHPWMKDRQVLQDILVPVLVSIGGIEGRTTSLRNALEGIFQQSFLQQPIPIVILGEPGSGKSVALRLATQMTWELRRKDVDAGYLPVLVTFSEFRTAGFDVQATVVGSMMRRGLYREQGDSNMAALVAVDGLKHGSLVLLFDGLDELDIGARAKASQALMRASSEYPEVLILFTCRTAAWKGPLRTQPVVELTTSPFNASAVREFVENWSFVPPKSRADLLEVIRNQPHVGNLSRNPLMLTIVCFLYSQPKYTLPKNRAEFYEVCTRALLEEWDQAQAPERANRFDRAHKEQALARVAHWHLSSSTPDDDIRETEALAEIGLCMEDELGLKRSENAALLEEIVLNSGLLVRVPPLGVRFPHQTFLEYFASLRILSNAQCSDLLCLFDSDSGRWKEVVLLYCGLNGRPATNDSVVEYMLRQGEPGTAISVVAQARTVSRKAARLALEAARAELLKGSDDDELISGLGYLSANELSSSGYEARAILLEALKHDNGRDFLRTQRLLVACLRHPDEKVLSLVAQRLDGIDFRRLLPVVGEKALPLLARVLRVEGLVLDKKREIIEGLVEAGAVELLVDLAGQSEVDSQSDKLLIEGLLVTSSLPAFWTRLDEVAEPMAIRRGIANSIGDTWPFDEPVTEDGRNVACFLCRELARRLEGKPGSGLTAVLGAHPWIEFVALLSYQGELSPESLAAIRPQIRPLASLPGWLARRFARMGGRLSDGYAASKHPLVLALTGVIFLCGLATPASVLLLLMGYGESPIRAQVLGVSLLVFWAGGYLAASRAPACLGKDVWAEEGGFPELVRPWLLPLFAAPFFSVLIFEALSERPRPNLQVLLAAFGSLTVLLVVTLGGLPWLLDWMLVLSLLQLFLVVPQFSAVPLPPPFPSPVGERVAEALENEEVPGT